MYVWTELYSIILKIYTYISFRIGIQNIFKVTYFNTQLCNTNKAICHSSMCILLKIFFLFFAVCVYLLFPGSSNGKKKKPACRNAEDLGWIPGLGRSPREGHGTHSGILAWRIPWTEVPRGLERGGKPTLHSLGCLIWDILDICLWGCISWLW